MTALRIYCDAADDDDDEEDDGDDDNNKTDAKTDDVRDAP
jgi:hypothetical protein